MSYIIYISLYYQWERPAADEVAYCIIYEGRYNNNRFDSLVGMGSRKARHAADTNTYDTINSPSIMMIV